MIKKKRKTRTLVNKYASAFLFAVTISVTAARLAIHAWNGDYNSLEKDLESFPVSCALAMNCDSVIDPISEALDKDDV